jgi:hypothetical protein
MTTEKDSDVVYLKPFNLDMINPSTEGAFGEKK